jgi:hypothetical protein
MLRFRRAFRDYRETLMMLRLSNLPLRQPIQPVHHRINQRIRLCQQSDLKVALHDSCSVVPFTRVRYHSRKLAFSYNDTGIIRAFLLASR